MQEEPPGNLQDVHRDRFKSGAVPRYSSWAGHFAKFFATEGVRLGSSVELEDNELHTTPYTAVLIHSPFVNKRHIIPTLPLIIDYILATMAFSTPPPQQTTSGQKPLQYTDMPFWGNGCNEPD